MGILKTRLPRKKFGDQVLDGLANGVPAFLNTYYQARKFANDERQQGVENELNRGKLGVDVGQLKNNRANTNLRGQEITKDYALEQGRNAREAAGNRLSVWKTAAGEQAQHAPEDYVQALGALEAGDPRAFSQTLGAARGVAGQNKVRETGRMSGARTAAAESVKSRQERQDALDMEATGRLRSGEIQQLPQGRQEFPIVRKSGKSAEELNADSNRRLSEKKITRIDQMIKANGGVPRSMAESTAVEMIMRNPQAAAAYQAADEKTRGEMEFDVISREGWADFIDD